MNAVEVAWLDLALAALLLLLPLGVLAYFRTGLTRTLLVSVGRMTLQLGLVGFYLQFLFDRNAPLLNLAWVTVMLLVATVSIVRRSELNARFFIFPVAAGLAAALVVTESVTLGVVLALENPFDARYLIPITGMILGNSLQTAIIGLRSFYRGLREQENRYLFYLGNGATSGEALAPFLRQALRDAFAPSLASMATLGLVALPGMMTGQILGGSDPLLAVRYQILIMIVIFTGTVTTVWISALASRPLVFDEYDRLKPEILKHRS